MISEHLSVSLHDLYDRWSVDDVQDAHLVLDAIEEASQ